MFCIRTTAVTSDPSERKRNEIKEKKKNESSKLSVRFITFRAYLKIVRISFLIFTGCFNIQDWHMAKTYFTYKYNIIFYYNNIYDCL